jgi:hypothetical protein
MTLMSLPTLALRAGRVVPLPTPPPGMYPIGII